MAPSEYPANPPTAPQTWDDIVVGCYSPRDAQRFAAHLRRVHDLDVSKVDGQNVHIPWRGAPSFLFDVMTVAVDGGYASDVVCAAAQRHRINEIERRNRPWNR